MSGLNRRRGIALLSLAGFFLSTYLFLYALGYYGELACGAGGGCDLVQGSRWARFLGFPVAGWGVAWYVAVFAVSILGTRDGAGAARWISRVLAVLALGGLGFTIYLTALELWVIHAICHWCVGSAAITVAIFLLTLPEFRAFSRRV
ncbi:vitamin K epoxide reductase family protein [Candidatus Palauibacter sp.]|uniref:vitamin K epoxide reductase family protein n=1 Tax=Candidatus Palauibacter sp. TaxID=3101350 RepID=UPI003C6F6332